MKCKYSNDLEALNKRADIEIKESKKLNKEADDLIKRTKYLFE